MNGSDHESQQPGRMAELQEQFESFQRSDQERQRLVATIIENYLQLEHQYNTLKSDYDHEIGSRRNFQQQVSDKKQELQLLRQQTEQSPFALVLIDGDGCQFLDHFLKQGPDGGAEAAYHLDTAIKEHLQQRHDITSGWTIMVHVYANFDGLSRKLAQCGIINVPSDLHGFARAFSYNQPLFNFSDVGFGKERADHKIKEMFRLYINNVHCKHIIFGGCHDHGYLPNLEPYRREKGVAARLTLLESTTAAPGYRHLNFPIASFDSVFRNEPLPDSRSIPGVPERFPPGLPIPQLQSQNSYPRSPSPVTNGHASSSFAMPKDAVPPSSTLFSLNTTASKDDMPSVSRTSSNSISPAQPHPKVAKPSPTPSPVTGSNPTKTSPYSITYATVGSGNKPQQKEISIEAKPVPQRKVVLLNYEDCRIDPALCQIDADTWEKFSNRIKRQKVCNHYHLNGNCKNGSLCNYSHEPRLTPKEQAALRSRARQTPCPGGSYCRDVDCHLGHLCPNEVATGECKFANCRFEDYHGMDQSVSARQYEDGHYEPVPRE